MKKLYNTHLECANAWNCIWKYMATCVNQELNISVDDLYLKLNKKLNNLHEQNEKCPRHKTAIHTTDTTHYTHTQNLSSVDFNNEKTNGTKILKKKINWIEIQFSYMFLYNIESFCNRDY
jgi:hypothetical protein